jgi:hypothetical protein
VFGALWPDAQQAIFGSGREQKTMIEAVSCCLRPCSPGPTSD